MFHRFFAYGLQFIRLCLQFSRCGMVHQQHAPQQQSNHHAETSSESRGYIQYAEARTSNHFGTRPENSRPRGQEQTATTPRVMAWQWTNRNSAIMVVAEKLKAEMWRGQVHTIDIMPEPTSRPRWTVQARGKTRNISRFCRLCGNTSRSSYL